MYRTIERPKNEIKDNPPPLRCRTTRRYPPSPGQHALSIEGGVFIFSFFPPMEKGNRVKDVV